MPKQPAEKVLVFLIAYVADPGTVNMEEGLEKLRETGAAQIIDVKMTEADENAWDNVARAAAGQVKAALSNGW